MQPPQPQFSKAKSRLSINVPEINSTSVHDAVAVKQSTTSSESHRSHLSQKNKKISSALITKRIKFIPLLILGLVCYGILFHIVTTIEPERVANVLWYQSYLPFHLVFLLGNFFLLNFIFLRTRRAAVWSIFLGVLLFFKLQTIAFTIPTILITIFIFIAIEVTFTFIFKK